MNPNKTTIAVLVITICCSGCGGGKPAIPDGTAESPKRTSPGDTVHEGVSEGVAYMKTIPSGMNKLNFSADESKSLVHSIETTPASGDPDKTHIHATVVNGKLQFSSDAQPEPSHISGSEPQVVLRRPNGSEVPVRVVATPEAATLLRARANP